MSLSNVILLQEMVVLGYKETKVFLKLLFEWECRTVDAIGLNIRKCYQHGTVKGTFLSIFYLRRNYVEKEGLETWITNKYFKLL